MNKALLSILVLTGLLAGCQQGKEQYDLRLQDAHESLSQGDPGKAERYLAEAEQIAAEHKIQQTSDAKLVQAEIAMLEGKVADAVSIARDLVADEKTSTTSRARAQEIIGKAALRQGRFDMAQENFVSAERGYDSEDDKQRIVDLIQLSRGLAAYSQGDIDVASKYWRAIKDADLRYSVNQNLQNAKTSVVH